MKVYVVKNDKGQYMTETIDFINSLWQAELFDDLELACCYTPTDCNVVECALMTPTEFQDYTKQVRKKVCEEIRAIFSKVYRECNSQRAMWDKFFSELDQIQGENK